MVVVVIVVALVVVVVVVLILETFDDIVFRFEDAFYFCYFIASICAISCCSKRLNFSELMSLMSAALH